MADAKHTPGPWEYSGGGIWGASPLNARVRLADITFHNSINGIAGEANAQIMAAAPDMLAALILAEDKYQRGLLNLTDEELEQVDAARRNAIAKATGTAI